MGLSFPQSWQRKVRGQVTVIFLCSFKSVELYAAIVDVPTVGLSSTQMLVSHVHLQPPA